MKLMWLLLLQLPYICSNERPRCLFQVSCSREALNTGDHINCDPWEPYLKNWVEPVNGEILICRKDHREEAKQYDKHVIGTYRISSKNDSMQLVGHVPKELWCIVCCFLSHCIGAFNWQRALIRASTAWS